MFLSRNMKNIRKFYLKICHFLVVKFSVYLNRRVFVMLHLVSVDYLASYSWQTCSITEAAKFI